MTGAPPSLRELAFAAVMTWLLLNALVAVLGAQP